MLADLSLQLRKQRANTLVNEMVCWDAMSNLFSWYEMESNAEMFSKANCDLGSNATLELV